MKFLIFIALQIKSIHRQKNKKVIISTNTTSTDYEKMSYCDIKSGVVYKTFIFTGWHLITMHSYFTKTCLRIRINCSNA